MTKKYCNVYFSSYLQTEPSSINIRVNKRFIAANLNMCGWSFVLHVVTDRGYFDFRLSGSYKYLNEAEINIAPGDLMKYKGLK